MTNMQETLDEIYQRFLNRDIRVGDPITSRSLPGAGGYVTGQGMLNGVAYWIYRKPNGQRDAMSKDEAWMMGFGRPEDWGEI